MIQMSYNKPGDIYTFKLDPETRKSLEIGQEILILGGAYAGKSGILKEIELTTAIISGSTYISLWITILNDIMRQVDEVHISSLIQKLGMWIEI